jgi:hypothetical protein
VVTVTRAMSIVNASLAWNKGLPTDISSHIFTRHTLLSHYMLAFWTIRHQPLTTLANITRLSITLRASVESNLSFCLQRRTLVRKWDLRIFCVSNMLLLIHRFCIFVPVSFSDTHSPVLDYNFSSSGCGCDVTKKKNIDEDDCLLGCCAV